MSNDIQPWICPYCGAENYSDHDASIVRPLCRKCSQPFITVARLEQQKKSESSELCGALTDLDAAIHNLRDMRESTNADLAEIDRKIYCNEQDRKMTKEEIGKWESLKIYLSAPDMYERAERARKDPYQRGLCV